MKTTIAYIPILLMLIFAGCSKQPDSQLAEANKRIKQLEAQIAEMQAEQVISNAKAPKQQPTAKTVEELAIILRGKSMVEVRSLLGPPNHTWDDDEQWVYNDMIVHPVTGKPDALYINFHGTGHVNSFSASASGRKFVP